jgi:hypothetical protein
LLRATDDGVSDVLVLDVGAPGDGSLEVPGTAVGFGCKPSVVEGDPGELVGAVVIEAAVVEVPFAFDMLRLGPPQPDRANSAAAAIITQLRRTALTLHFDQARITKQSNVDSRRCRAWRVASSYLSDKACYATDREKREQQSVAHRLALLAAM